MKSITKKYLSLIYNLVPKEHTIGLLITIIMMIAGVICGVVAPVILKKIIDKLIVNPSLSPVITLFVLYCGLLLLSKLLNELKFIVYAAWEQNLVKNGLAHVFKSLLYNTSSFFTSNMPGSISSRVYQSIFGLKIYLFNYIFHVFPLILEFLLVVIVLATVCDIRMALTVGVGLIIYTYSLIRLNGRLLNYQTEVRNATVDSQGVTTSLIGNWKDIKLANGYKTAFRIFSRNIDKLTEKSLIFYKKRGVFGFLQSLPLYLVFVVANLEAITDYTSGVITIGSILLINNYLLQIVKPLEMLGILFRDTSRSYSDFIAIDYVLNHKKENLKLDGVVEEASEYNIQFRDVSVNNILQNINLELRKGDKIAIVGESGAGKTSLIALLSGIEENYSGEILVNGVNIKKIHTNILRKKINYLSSDAKLINGTIKENLLLSEFSSESLIPDALAYACIYEKVNAIPNGLDTDIDDTTSLLSSGEKQRIKIARTYLLPGFIKIYDESTSSIDAYLEEKFVDNILADKNSSVLYVTHKLGNLYKFDRIYYLSNKQIVEFGHHDELIQAKGGYYHLWKQYV